MALQAGVRIRRRHGGDFARGCDERHIVRRQPERGAHAIVDGCRREAGDLAEADLFANLARTCVSVEHRALRRYGGDPLVARRGDDHVAARQRATPQADAGGIDARHGAGKGNGRLPVVELARDGNELPRFTVAGAEVAVVEQHDVEAGIGEALGVRLERGVARAAETMGHDDAGSRARGGLGRHVQPGTAGHAAAQECDFPAECGRHAFLRQACRPAFVVLSSLADAHDVTFAVGKRPTILGREVLPRFLKEQHVSNVVLKALPNGGVASVNARHRLADAEEINRLGGRAGRCRRSLGNGLAGCGAPA